MKYHKPPFLLKECKIELTYKCPLACIHCSSDATPNNIIEIGESKCYQIIKEANDLGVREMSFSGGEPLLWNNIEKAISLAVSYGMEVTIYSSGNISNPNTKIKTLASCGTSRIVYSVFGSNHLSHERITRIKDSFKKTMRAIDAAKEADLDVEFHFVPLALNYRELPGIVELAESLNIKTVSILRFVPQGRGYLIRKYALNRLQNIELKKFIQDARRNGFSIRTGSPFNFLLLNNQPKCASGINRTIIGPDLRIYPCDAFKQIKAEELVGTIMYSILDGWSLQECWENSPFLLAIREYLTSDFQEPCASCCNLEMCLSGCLAQKVLQTMDLRKQPDPMCIMNSN